jgi:general secretion pathway protein L
MTFLRQIIDAFSAWMDSVATTINSIFDRLGSQPRVRLVEDAPDTFTLHMLDDGKHANLPDHRIRMAGGAIDDALPPEWATALHGSRAELVLRPARFLFRPLELPKRATEYLEGIVRSQIDRLTPWTASEAVYSWTPPVDATGDRIHLTIAATARSMVAPYLQAIAGLGAASIVVATTAPGAEPDAVPMRVLEHRTPSAIDVGRIRTMLVAVFLLTGLLAAVSIGVASVVGDNLATEQQDLQRKISARRAAMRGGQDAIGASALQLLERRKHTKPSSVVVLEALSRLLPDHTYVTELRVDGEKLQVVGLTRDAPSLIELIEQSPHFARATFFAATTRSPGDAGERFHIEARINRVFGFGT